MGSWCLSRSRNVTANCRINTDWKRRTISGHRGGPPHTSTLLDMAKMDIASV